MSTNLILTSNPAQTNTVGLVEDAATGMYTWLVAWTIFVIGWWLINKTRLGHTVLYYGIVLLIFLTLVTNYQFVANALKVFNPKQMTKNITVHST